MHDCPDRDELQALLAGRHPPESQPLLESHLETCERCRQLLDGLADVRAVVPDPPSLGEKSTPASPALRRVMEELRADPCPAEAAPQRPPFLQPTDRPGFLGKLGPYEVKRLIGSGGTGMVFEGFDPDLKRTVAIKVLSPFLAANDQARA